MSDVPENTRWSLNNLSKCGMKTFLRPCQVDEQKFEAESGFPLHTICQPLRESVFIIDDDVHALEELVEKVRILGYDAVGFASGSDLQNVSDENLSGCILLDIKLPGQDGIAIHEWIKKKNLSLSVIYVSGTDDVGTVAHCMKIGAVEFIKKPVAEMSLRDALHKGIAEARRSRCRSESRQFIESILSTLTPTERLVANMIAKGYPTKSVANDMGRSENTIKIHRHRIFSKLKVNSTASIANIFSII